MKTEFTNDLMVSVQPEEIYIVFCEQFGRHCGNCIADLTIKEIKKKYKLYLETKKDFSIFITNLSKNIGYI